MSKAKPARRTFDGVSWDGNTIYLIDGLAEATQSTVEALAEGSAA